MVWNELSVVSRVDERAVDLAPPDHICEVALSNAGFATMLLQVAQFLNFKNPEHAVQMKSPVTAAPPD